MSPWVMRRMPVSWLQASFFLNRGIYPLLDLSPESRNVGPLPDRVREETLQCFVNGDAEAPVSKFDIWADSAICPAATATASSTGEVYASALLAVGAESPEATQLRGLLTAAGFHQDSTMRIAGKRFYVKNFEGWVGPQPVGLK